MRRVILYTSMLIALQTGIAAAAQTYVVSISDIHFDPFGYCKNNANCPLVEKLRQADPSAWPAILKTTDPQLPQFKQDTNYALLHSTLQDLQQVSAAENPKWVLVLGDMLGHNFRRNFIKYSKDKSRVAYRTFVSKTFNFITQQIQQTFPNCKIFNVVGNNDSYMGNYVTDVGGIFFSDTGRLWSQAAQNGSLAAQFATAGYYAVNLQEDLRLIALNTNLFSYNARGKNLDAAAQAELGWLQGQLQAAKAAQQQVMIAMHIPPGINLYASSFLPSVTVLNLWAAPYQQTYDNLIATYSPQIIGIFAGHLHADWYQTNNVGGRSIPFAVTPAVSPVYETNPAYKIYTYADNRLTGFTTHQLPLNLKRASLLQTSFNLSQNLRCDNAVYSQQLSGWNSYYHCNIL